MTPTLTPIPLSFYSSELDGRQVGLGADLSDLFRFGVDQTSKLSSDDDISS